MLCLIASVTSEPTKGGHLLSALAALERTDAGFTIDREAPHRHRWQAGRRLSRHHAQKP